MVFGKIKLKNFELKKTNFKLINDLKLLTKENNKILNTLKPTYKYSYTKSIILRNKKFTKLNIIGMGGSILGVEAIYNFLKSKIKKKIVFFNNLIPNLKSEKNNKKDLNLIISKSGNTLETIVSSNILIKNKNKNIFIVENQKNYLNNLAKKLKGEIIEHKNYIGGRYSVLSEVGMLPSELMGLNEKNFKQFNFLIKNKNFINNLIKSVESILFYLSRGKSNSIILNYDENSEKLFLWYQQLVAESLGKKGKGILPTISSMPKDNHSLMQYYLDGPKNNFFTFFYTFEKKSEKIQNQNLLKSHNYLRNKYVNKILFTQKIATENVFKSKKIPFRSFEIYKRDEKTIGQLFCFFILETILLGRALKVNPYDQPSVELIKKETKKIFLKN
tara:strand:+ start:13 stop:1176 length:1164 start_codon:yes stop_codon:yes gene_type:complete